MSSGAIPAPPQRGALRVTPPKLGDSYAKVVDLRVHCERSFLDDGRTLVSDHRVTGSHARLYRCAGAIIKKGEKSTGGCSAFVRANKRKDNHYYITGLSLDHQNCAGGKKKPSLRALSVEGAVVVNANRKITAGGLSKTLKGTYGVELTQHTANRLKRGVIGVTLGAQVEGYQRLESFLLLTAAGSPGTVTHSEFDGNGKFVKCFLMLGAVANFAVQGVQQVACMDFAHLKGDWNGTIGTISMKSSNNQIIHVATCITAKETGDAYRYLISNAMKNPRMAHFLNKATTTIITDKHKGSDVAIPELLPLADNLRCVEHMLKNNGAVGPMGRVAMYEAAKAPHKAGCEQQLQKIKELNKVAGDKIASIPRDTWAMYATRGNRVWDQTTSNMSESTNHAIGEQTRAKPVLDVCQDIIMWSTAKLSEAAGLKANDSTAKFTPFACKTFNAELEWSKTCDVNQLGQGRAMVYPNNDRRHYNVVKLIFDDDPSNHVCECTCTFVVRFAIPCRHVIAVATANNKQDKLFDLVDDGYLLENFRAAASDPRYHVMPPVWASLDVNTMHKAPLWVEGQAGRKKGVRQCKRRKSNGEFATSSRSYALHVANSTSQDNATLPLSQMSQGDAAGDGGVGQ